MILKPSMSLSHLRPCRLPCRRNRHGPAAVVMLVEKVADQLPVTPLTLGECIRRPASAAVEVCDGVQPADCYPLRRNGSWVKGGRRCGGDEANRHGRLLRWPGWLAVAAAVPGPTRSLYRSLKTSKIILEIMVGIDPGIPDGRAPGMAGERRGREMTRQALQPSQEPQRARRRRMRASPAL